MITFDLNGYLTPYDINEMECEEFVQHFVTNDHRVIIFEEYKKFVDALKELGVGQFIQWINGSFVSGNPRPADIDLVTFIDFNIYGTCETELSVLKSTLRLVDAYYVKEYPSEHPNHFITNFDRIEWKFLFSTDRKKRKKGFVQLNF